MRRQSSARRQQQRRARRLAEQHDLRSGPPWDVHGVTVPAGSIVVDRDYEVLRNARHRLVTNVAGEVTFDEACVTIHLGDKAQRLTKERTQAAVHPIDGKFRIAAGDVLSIESQETFRLPADVQGQVSPKAQLTTLGLFFPTTHVDPGFSGHLFLPIINAGPRAVELPVEAAVGKVELQRLSTAVQNPWKGSTAFSHFQQDWVQGGLTVAEERERVTARIHFLQWWLILLTGALIAQIIWPTVRSVGGVQLPSFAEKIVAPLAVALVLAIIALVMPRVRDKCAALWTRFRLKPLDGA